MGEVTSRRHCHSCGQFRLFQKQRINHVLHLLLTVLSGGLWVVVWLVLGIRNLDAPFVCPICGEGSRESRA